MKILLVYVAVSQGLRTEEFAERFVRTYLNFPAGVGHEMCVACNGGPLPEKAGLPFTVVKTTFLPRVNDGGWDITAFQDIAADTRAEMMVCLGESVHFWREGWLKRMVEAWTEFGPGMYGFWSSNLVRAHLNTTAFVTAPAFLLHYPRPANRQDRYDFEHGEHAYWRMLAGIGKPTKLVTWDGCYDPPEWRSPRDILWRGSQANCLAWCSHTDRYRALRPTVKRQWEHCIDQPYA